MRPTSSPSNHLRTAWGWPVQLGMVRGTGEDAHVQKTRPGPRSSRAQPTPGGGSRGQRGSGSRGRPGLPRCLQHAGQASCHRGPFQGVDEARKGTTAPALPAPHPCR